MILADNSHSTFRLFTAGPVPGWAGLLLFVAVGALVLWHLRRDFAGVKATRLIRRVLPTVRLTIVAMIAWLLCQPVLLVEGRWTSPPQVMLVVDSGNSMRVNESAGGISRQLDILESVGKPIAKRNNAASHTARACDAISRAAMSAMGALQEDQEAASTGLPLGPSVGRKVEALAAVLREQADVLIAARALAPSDAQIPTADNHLKQSLTELVAASQRVGAAVDSAVAEGAIVAREAPRSPSLLDGYLVRLKKLGADADAARKRAADVQETLDKTLLSAKEVEAIRATPMTRQALAEWAADRLLAGSGQAPSTSSGQAAGVAWDRGHSPALAAALDDAFRKNLESPLAGVVLLSDGSSPPPATAGGAGSAHGRLAVPVSTVLIGADGQEPADAGLVAIDVPRVALAGEALTVRCLVKNLVTATPPPRLTLTVGKETVGTRDLPFTKEGYETIEFSWTPAAPGRSQLVFRIESARADAYPGNEASAAIVDVIANKAHVLIVTDRLTGDFAAISQLLAAMPAADARSILAVPGLSKFHTGSKSDDFPATAGDFKALSLLVLIGDVPEAAGNDAIDALKKAIDAGLRVWVQTPNLARSVRPWATALGIETKPIAGPHAIQRVDDLWLNLYQLGRETDESAARWKALPHIAGLSEIVTPGVPLLTAEGRPVLQLVPRQSGAAIVCGISDFTALRSPSTAASANRLLVESLVLGLTPIIEPGTNGGAGLFPPQPVLGRNILLFGDASGGKGLEAATGGAPTFTGAKAWRVSDPQTIAAQVGGAPIERVVRQLVGRQDFQLAAHAEPLEKIARETGGRHRDLLSAMDVLPPGLKGAPCSSATRVALWPGYWSLFVILALVSAEYLLRRRAGKVM